MTDGYSALDRILYRLALGNLTLQKSLADLETRLHAGRLREIASERPVFVTSLPRAGTTVLLEALNDTGAFACQTYHDMPFVLCPLLWHAVSRGFRRDDGRRERAHGDGVLIGYDSAEAFEEVLWKAFWPEKYAADRILTWSGHERDGEFEAAFASHQRKVIALHGGARGTRYLSKNNANIARLPVLAELYPDCTILIAFRNPGDHAASLARQHANFLALHDADRFARQYMEWLGHYEFGRAFRPIVFDGDDGGDDCGDAGKPGYWLGYWERAFAHILRHAPPQAVFLDYDRLCDSPHEWLGRLAEILGLRPAALQDQAGRFRAANRYAPPAELAQRAAETYSLLQRRSERDTLHGRSSSVATA